MDYGGDYGGYGGGGGYNDYGDTGGGGGGHDGGGYGQDNAGNDGKGGSNSNKKGNSNAANSTLTPVTLKMLATATRDPDDSFVINGRAIGKVVTYGMVKQKTDKSSSYTLILDDGTFQMEATRWKEQDESEQAQMQRESIVQGTYVCVHGIVKNYMDNRFINATSVRIVTDHNELTHHALDVLYVSLQVTRGPLPRPAEMNTSSSSNPQGMKISPSKSGMGAVSTFNPYGAAPVSRGGKAYGSNNMMVETGAFNMHQQLVLDAFANDGGSDTGLSIMDVARKLTKQGIHLEEVRRITDFLVQDGHIYSTIDDNHFKSTGDS